MLYNLVSEKSPVAEENISAYSIESGEPFVDYDAGRVFQEICTKHFPDLNWNFESLAERRGTGNRMERLFKVTFAKSPDSHFFVYCFQTEGGGRSGLPNEGRIQWRPRHLWIPNLVNHAVADQFAKEIQQKSADLSNKECYIFAFYKRNPDDTDVVVSAVYPTQAQDVEFASKTSKSIQYQYLDILKAFHHGVSATHKGNGESIIHFRPEYLLWYMINRDALHMRTLEEFNSLLATLQPSPSARATGSLPLDIPRNKIIYGAPGTGKSYKLRQQVIDYGFSPERIIRVTFHANYSYSQFVGSYRPTPIYKSMTDETVELYGSDRTTLLQTPENKEPLIDYAFVPGPFLTQLINARLNPEHNYLIIIEEINRASASAVFGDIFQLLDRGTDGASEYEVEFSRDVSAFLRSCGITDTKVKIPQNLFLWATMNSADQGVVPLDAAFKRRWSFEYLPLDEMENQVSAELISFQGKLINWNKLRKVLNAKLKSLGVAEDKLIGPFFLKKSELQDDGAVKNKLLLYLRDDVVRHNPDLLFKKTAFSDIVHSYDSGDEIFVDLSIGTIESPSQEAP